MYIENTPTPTAESENTGMTSYCGTGKELLGSEKPQMLRACTPASTQQEKMV